MAGTLLIRADAGEGTGTGHVMRQLALAQAWQSEGGRVVLLSHCPVPSLPERIRAAGVALEPLAARHPDPADLSATLPFLKSTRSKCKGSPVRWVILDGYHFDTAYQEAIRQAGCRLLVVDDMAHLPEYHADLLLNQNLARDQLEYTCDEHTTPMLGPRYALIRPEFCPREGPSRTVPETARKVLVTLGGEDPENMTSLVVRALERLDLPGLEGRIVVGAAHAHVETLRARIQRSSANLRLLTNVTDMPSQMAWADVAVTAAGSTCWELALLGVPAVAIVLAENQRIVAEELARKGVVVNLGWFRPLTAEAIAQGLASLCRDRGRRARQSEAGRRLVDGRGADRVVAVMHALDGPIPEDQLVLRPVAADDLFAVWRLANAPTVRGNSLSTEPIPLEAHVAWFDQKLSSPDTRMWVLDFHGLVIGQIRYDRAEASTAEISLSMAAPFRRRGLGQKLLAGTYLLAARQLRVNRFRAVVRKENVASMRMFSKAGFAKAKSSTGSPIERFLKVDSTRSAWVS